MMKRRSIVALFALLAATLLRAETPLEEAWKLADRARDAAHAGRGQEAIELYYAAIELAPESMPIRRDYATVLGWLGYHQSASREFRYVFEMDAEQPGWALQEMANAHFFGGDDEGALAAFDRLIAEGGHEEATLTRRALTLLRLGAAEEAEEQYREALALYPESDAAAVGIVQAMARQGRPEDAYVAAVSWGAEAEPESEIRLWAARMLTAMGRHEEALEAFERLPAAQQERPEAAEALATARRLRAWAEINTPERAAAGLREGGVRAGRAGKTELGAAYLEHALKINPESVDLLRDYAIVLGWGERYERSLEAFDRLLAVAPEQPGWALSELARVQLFGGRTEAALRSLDRLIADGRGDLGVHSRRGLALRWLGRSEEAAAEYRRVMREFPESPVGPNGLAHALADRHRLADALDVTADAVARFPDDVALQTTRAQVLNWAGRHVQARKALQALPDDYLDQGVVMQHRTLAARWAQRPKEAFDLATRFYQAHPSDPQSEKLLRALSYEYGSSLRVLAEGVSDSNGYAYRGAAAHVEMPLSAASRLYFQYGHRRYEDRFQEPGALEWNQYRAGWSAAMGRRVSTNLSVAGVDYGLAGAAARVIGDASVSAIVTDWLRASAGAGITPAETLPALRERLTARYFWTSADLRPMLKLDFGARYAVHAFGDGATRRTVGLSAFRTVSERGGHKVRVGGRSQWMWHSQWSRLFWSPEFFHTHLASFRMEGRLPGRVDYVGEIGAGVQREAGYRWQTPLVTTIEVAKRLRPDLWLRVKAGYSNSSLDRINPGAASYQFWYFQGGLDFRFDRWR